MISEALITSFNKEAKTILLENKIHPKYHVRIINTAMTLISYCLSQQGHINLPIVIEGLNAARMELEKDCGIPSNLGSDKHTLFDLIDSEAAKAILNPVAAELFSPSPSPILTRGFFAQSHAGSATASNNTPDSIAGPSYRK